MIADLTHFKLHMSNITIEKARVADIQVGKITIKGLMFPDSSFGLSLTQAWEVAECYGVNDSKGSIIALHKNEVRQTKALLGKDFSPVKQLTELNSNKTYCLTLLEFELFLAKADRKGYAGAQNFRDDLIGLSLVQLWSDGFNIKFEKEERVQYLANRQEHLKQFHTRLTKWWKLDGCKSGKDYMQRVIDFKDAIGIPKFVSVNEYDYSTLLIINTKETQYDAFRQCGLSHKDAITKL